jgi:hypothetical protein
VTKAAARGKEVERDGSSSQPRRGRDRAGPDPANEIQPPSPPAAIFGCHRYYAIQHVAHPVTRHCSRTRNHLHDVLSLLQKVDSQPSSSQNLHAENNQRQISLSGNPPSTARGLLNSPRPSWHQATDILTGVCHKAPYSLVPVVLSPASLHLHASRESSGSTAPGWRVREPIRLSAEAVFSDTVAIGYSHARTSRARFTLSRPPTSTRLGHISHL